MILCVWLPYWTFHETLICFSITLHWYSSCALLALVSQLSLKDSTTGSQDYLWETLQLPMKLEPTTVP